MESNEEGTLTADRHITMAKRNVLDINSMGYIDLENLLFPVCYVGHFVVT